MSVFFSRQCEYALQAVLYLALKPQGERSSIKELTARLDIPYHFLAKILQDLTRKGLLASMKGPTGGFTLGRSPEHITLFDIVAAIDGTAFVDHCILGFSDCSNESPCPVHKKWAVLRDRMRVMLLSRNIARMAEETRKLPYTTASRNR